MKKQLTAIALLSAFAASAYAAPVGKTFTGFGVGVGLESTKYMGAKRTTGANIIADYGIDYGNDFVGLIEGKLKVNNSKAMDKSDENKKKTIKEKANLSVAYLQGYRVLPDLLPYVKVNYNIAQATVEESGNGYSKSTTTTGDSGFGYGVGVKYAVSSNVELGAEYLRTHRKFNNEKLRANNLSANATYRF